MDEVTTQFDPRDKANISWNAPQDFLDYDAKVTVNFRQLERNWRELKDNDIDLRGIINNPVSELIANSGGSEESLYRLGRTDDIQNLIFPNGGLTTGTIRKRVTLTLSNTIKAASVARATVGDLYFAALDHPPARGPGIMVIPAESSEGHVQLGAVTLSRITIDSQPQQFKNVVITDELIKKSLNWIVKLLHYITRSYDWNLGMIDKDAFIPVRLLFSKLQACWNASSSDHSTILYPTKHLLSLILLTDNSGDFEQWAGISPIFWARIFHRVHKYVVKGE